MRTNIEIDDGLMAKALEAGPYKTKKEAVEAGLKLLARQAAYREILKWRGKLKWEGDESIDWVAANRSDAQAALGGSVAEVQEPSVAYGTKPTRAPAEPKAAAPARKRADAKARRAGG